MKLRPYILSTSLLSWLPECIEEIRETTLLARGIEDIAPFAAFQMAEPPRTIPTRVDRDGDRKPQWDWVKGIMTGGMASDFNVNAFHMTRADRKRWKLSPRVGGSYCNDDAGDDAFYFYIIADTPDEFTRIFLHELGHGFERWIWGKHVQFVHHFDYVQHDLKAFYRLMDFTENNRLTKERDTLKATLEGLKKGV